MLLFRAIPSHSVSNRRPFSASIATETSRYWLFQNAHASVPVGLPNDLLFRHPPSHRLALPHPCHAQFHHAPASIPETPLRCPCSFSASPPSCVFQETPMRAVRQPTRCRFTQQVCRGCIKQINPLRTFRTACHGSVMWNVPNSYGFA